MSHLLRITDNTDTVTVSSGDMYIADYVPRVSMRDDPINETAMIGFTGGLSTIRANVQSLNRLFVQAANYRRNQTGARVYVEFDPDTSGTVYRSQLYSGMVEMTDDVLGNQWGSGTLELELSWIREPYWEGPETQIPLSNTGTAATTDGVAISNYSATDTGAENWVSIASTDIAGDLPALFKVEMYNSYSTTDATDEIYIFHNIHSTPASLTHIVEGESGSGAGVAATTDTTCSGGSYAAITWSSTDEQWLETWQFSDAQQTYQAGGRFAVLARWNGAFPYDDCWMRLKLASSGTNVIWNGDLSLVSSSTDGRELTMLDTLRLPPYLDGQTDLAGIYLALTALRGSTDNAVSLDYLQLSPISGDNGWKRFLSVDNGIAYQEYFYHDAIEGYDYRVNTSGKKVAEFTSYGGPILLEPNENQRLYFLTCNNVGDASISQTWNIKAWYRPRRASI